MSISVICVLFDNQPQNPLESEVFPAGGFALCDLPYASQLRAARLSALRLGGLSYIVNTLSLKALNTVTH